MGESIWADAHWSGASNRKFISGIVTDLGVWGGLSFCSKVLNFKLMSGLLFFNKFLWLQRKTDVCLRSEAFNNIGGDGGALEHNL